ncbi:MAG: phosphoenolpyruvate--protein phosphotransferase [Deltaproteobacteria bacterium]|nr:phosphoenolpyruvate--protein phosphotransferase [Deltaproteobacteria bacterium]
MKNRTAKTTRALASPKSGGGGQRRVFKGDPVGRGIAIGKAVLYGARSVSFPKYWINDSETKNEVQRFRKALSQCKNQMDEIKTKLCRIDSRDPISIIDSHILLLQDELLVRNAVSAIEKEHINAEWALNKTIAEIKQAFSKISQTYLRERKYDIDYIENAIQRNLAGQDQGLSKKVEPGSVVVAYDLSPAETIQLIRTKIAGFVTERGGLNSHTAIVARSLKIPSIVGIDAVFDRVGEGNMMIVNGETGEIIINPRASELEKFQKTRKTQIELDLKMKKEARFESKTIDGSNIKILANMELPDEMEFIKAYGAEGVGLYRTEFLFLDRPSPPTEEEQEEIYKTVLKKLKPLEVTIRTIDLGADKISAHNDYADQINPAMGLRAVRLCLRERDIFVRQLRALLRAATEGNLKICLPMISSLDEFRKIKKIFREVIAGLKREKVRVPDHVPLGVMIETPAAAIEIDLLAQEADFFSVGTNDLIQYLLAVDRTNELVSYLYNPLHPSVIRTLKQIMDTAERFGKEVTICGEMAGEPLYLLVLIAMGFNRLSMNPASIPKLKKILRMTRLTDTQKLLSDVLASDSYKENERILENKMHDLFPEYFQ